jgi:hypothetical protein
MEFQVDSFGTNDETNARISARTPLALSMTPMPGWRACARAFRHLSSSRDISMNQYRRFAVLESGQRRGLRGLCRKMIDVLHNEHRRDEARTDASLRDHLGRQRGNQGST